MVITVEKIEQNLEKNPKLKKEQIVPLLPSLQDFLIELDNQYRESMCNISLFNTTPELDWSSERKKFFCKILYHARGRLHEFLWHLGNIAPDMQSKELILYNYAEEFGGHSPSHEQLYFYFTKDMGIPSPDEVTDSKYYLSFFKEYNAGHMNWLKNNEWDGCFSAFSAYERLDNLDYSNLYTLAKNLGATTKGLIFFRVHAEVEHFSATTKPLNNCWERNEEIVKQAFIFIYKHQEDMWKKISEKVFNFE